MQADMWAYGILLWEIVCAADIDCSQAAGVYWPPAAPHVARHIFEACTQLEAALRPNAQQVVEWLRASFSANAD